MQITQDLAAINLQTGTIGSTITLQVLDVAV
jgi:hypothetical protein